MGASETEVLETVERLKDVGKLMENAVFLELMRAINEKPMLEIYYWKHNHEEVDFILKEGASVKELIQVTYARRRDEIDKRKTKSLLKASEK